MAAAAAAKSRPPIGPGDAAAARAARLTAPEVRARLAKAAADDMKSKEEAEATAKQHLIASA